MTFTAPPRGCFSGRAIKREDIPGWITVDSEGRVWTSRNLGGWPTNPAVLRRAERRMGRGYLSVLIHGAVVPAHRIVYAYHYGEVPAGSLVCHLNGNRVDNRPLNLALGTNQDNMDDAKQMHRFTGNHARGAKNTNAKLTDAKVRAIRAEHASGTTQTVLARKHGVSQASMSSLIRRETWKHVD